MSVLRVNRLESATGSNITIPTGYSLNVGGLLINEDSLPPSPAGQAGKFLYSDGSDVIWQVAGPASIQTFTSSGTWTKPAGVTRVLVQLVGGGGAASGFNESGGAGGYSEKLIDVSGTSSVTVTIGQGSGSWTYYSGSAGAGGTTSFGSFCSATGGNGANSSHQHCGGLPGVGSGGDFNQYGGGGTGHMGWATGKGGHTWFGGAGATGHPQGGNFAHNHRTHSAPGCGGTGGYSTSNHGATGRDGMVVVYEYN